MEARAVPTDQIREGSTQGIRMRQTTLGGWCMETTNSIKSQHKDSTHLLSAGFTRLEIDATELSQADGGHYFI